MYVCQPLKRMSFAETERVKQTIPFEEVKYGETFTNETYDIYGIDLPKGIKLVLNFFFFGVLHICCFIPIDSRFGKAIRSKVRY